MSAAPGFRIGKAGDQRVILDPAGQPVILFEMDETRRLGNVRRFNYEPWLGEGWGDSTWDYGPQHLVAFLNGKEANNRSGFSLEFTLNKETLQALEALKKKWAQGL